MAKKRRLATILTYLTLEIGAMMGVPIRPEQIEELTRALNGTQVVHVVREEESGDPPGER
jgi:hypothetical protein